LAEYVHDLAAAIPAKAVSHRNKRCEVQVPSTLVCCGPVDVASDVLAMVKLTAFILERLLSLLRLADSIRKAL
jgi:hypothetical protein